MQPTTEFVTTNPYVTQTAVSLFDLQLLLLAAVVSLVIGLLLAEQTTLRQILTGTDETLSALIRRRVTETI